MSRESAHEAELQQSISDIFDLDADEADDDMWEPATEDSTVESTVDEELEEYEDAGEGALQEDNGEIEISLEIDGEDEEAEEEEEAEETETEGTAATTTTTEPTPATREDEALQTLQRLIASGRLGNGNTLQRLLAGRGYRIIVNGQDLADLNNDDDDDDDGNWNYRRRRRTRTTKPDPNRFPKVPNPAGRDLMHSGVFGARDRRIEQICRRKASIAERLLWRRLGYSARPTAQRETKILAQDMVPNSSMADKIIHYDSRAYSGQYSDDGNFFFSCTQNFKVQMYDTSNPYEWKYYKTVDFPFGQWTITDATLSPNNRFLAYSSIRHTVCLAPTDPNDHNDHVMLNFADYAPNASLDVHGGGMAYMGRQGFGIWSLRFSGDGREIVAGTSDHNVLVYDLESRRTILKLRKHDDDVNAVCFGDKSSPHILFSGSDDQTLRVWDRRSMASGQEAGVFVGHTEGLTYVDSKGDGRYVVSNGKDQTMKLWDLRKMVSPHDFSEMNLARYTSNFDYRFSGYNEDDWIPNPDDCSVVTFRGHKVLKTLIRCHFSPPGSSNSAYVYSGSEDGKVYIWNLDATLRGTIDVASATKESRPKIPGGGGDWDMDMGYSSNVWKTCVRDASWSPTVPVIAATSWNGWGMATGTVSLHGWNPNTTGQDDGDPPMGTSYDAKLRPRESPAAAHRRQQRMREEYAARRRQEMENSDDDGTTARSGIRSNPVRAARTRSARHVMVEDDGEEDW